MLSRVLVACLALGWLANAACGDEPPKWKPIDAETIAAYEKLGAEYGGIGVLEFGGLRFSPGNEAAAKGLPGFKFPTGVAK